MFAFVLTTHFDEGPFMPTSDVSLVRALGETPEAAHLAGVAWLDSAEGKKELATDGEATYTFAAEPISDKAARLFAAEQDPYSLAHRDGQWIIDPAIGGDEYLARFLAEQEDDEAEEDEAEEDEDDEEDDEEDEEGQPSVCLHCGDKAPRHVPLDEGSDTQLAVDPCGRCGRHAVRPDT